HQVGRCNHHDHQEQHGVIFLSILNNGKLSRSFMINHREIPADEFVHEIFLRIKLVLSSGNQNPETGIEENRDENIKYRMTFFNYNNTQQDEDHAKNNGAENSIKKNLVIIFF